MTQIFRGTAYWFSSYPCETSFNSVTESYLIVCNNTYCEDILAERQPKKKLAHRQQIAATSITASEKSIAARTPGEASRKRREPAQSKKVFKTYSFYLPFLICVCMYLYIVAKSAGERGGIFTE